jgi:DNA replication protein DnaC
MRCYMNNNIHENFSQFWLAKSSEISVKNEIQCKKWNTVQKKKYSAKKEIQCKKRNTVQKMKSSAKSENIKYKNPNITSDKIFE